MYKVVFKQSETVNEILTNDLNKIIEYGEDENFLYVEPVCCGGKSMKNLIIKIIVCISLLLFILGACTVDSDSNIPMFMILGSLFILLPIAYANKEKVLPKED